MRAPTSAGPETAGSGPILLLLKNLAFTVIVPGTTGVLLPRLIVSGTAAARPAAWGALEIAAAACAIAGALIYARCAWDFARRGRATPAPIDAPRVLVVQGLYRYVRNPMYLGVLLVIAAQALFHRSAALAAYAAGFLLVVHLFTVLYEEPTLLRLFGPSYEEYRRAVRRWIPGRPYGGG
jgi:protein-S-isoprenylcysteine O-methyltransferase Ste14